MEGLKVKKLLAFLNYFVIFLAFVVAIIIFSTVFNTPFGFKFLVVESGSMEPAIKTGSLIIVAKSNTFNIGDIITFKKSQPVNKKTKLGTTTHRIVGMEKNNFITKGDANKNNDDKTVGKQLIIGKVKFTIPILGYVISFAKTQTGFILLMVIPAIIIIYSELLNIKKEMSKR